MKNFTTDFIRNVALIGHSGEGKTSLAEAMMFSSQTIDRLGRVDDGNSTMDFDDEEIRRKISISMSLGYALRRDYKINVLDVPGFFDFEGDLTAALSAADSALIVTTASGALSVGTEKALDTCLEKGVPAFIFVNALDKDNSDFFATLDAINAKYPKVVPIYIPIMDGKTMLGSVDVFTGAAQTLDGAPLDVPSDIADKAKAYNSKLMETIAESDDALMSKFFEGVPFTADEIKSGLLKAIDSDAFVPLMAGIATSCSGVNELMDKIIDLMPSPLQTRSIKATKDGNEVDVSVNPDAPFAAHVFKSVVDPYVGKMLLFKVLTGKVSSGDTVYNPNSDKNEKIGTLYVVKGKKQEAVTELNAGDIGAVAKLAYTSTNDTLCADDNRLTIAKIAFPKPVLSYAVSAPKDEEKVIQALIKMQDEDPTFKVEKNVETGDVLISGLGEAQLDVMCKRVKNKVGLDTVLSTPRIAYRETIRRKAEAEGRHKKQNGGAGQFGDAYVRFEPGAEDGVYEFVDAVVGGAVPKNFIPAVDKGLREAILHGVLAGYPVYNLKCTLFDGSYHPVDSKEVAFVSAAKLAFNAALPEADPCFIEPIMTATVTVPNDYQGAILADMTSSRRARIIDNNVSGDKTTIVVEVPQSEMFKYATDLRSMTQAKGKFEMKFARYEEVPSMMNAKIIEDAQKRAEADAAKKA